MNEDNVNLLRPKFLKDFIGQEDLKKNLDIFVASSKKRRDILDHCLFFGPPGLGKTSLARIIAREMQVNFHVLSGTGIRKSGDIVSVLTSIDNGDIVFIDEIHRLYIALQELLYTAMEDFKIDIVIGEGAASRIANISIKPFTLIGATTHPGKISKPFRDRFGILGHLVPYSVNDLCTLVMRNSQYMAIDISKEACYAIAERARGTPRVANVLLRRARDFSLNKNNGKIDVATVNEALYAMKIDKLGLNECDNRYISCLIRRFKGGPVGLNTLVSTLNESRDVIEDIIEPFLLHLGLICITSRGRKATDYTYKIFKEKQCSGSI